MNLWKLYIYIYTYIYIYIFKVKEVFICKESSYWWYRAGKWQIHYVIQNTKKKIVSRSLSYIFICFFNFKREKSKLLFCFCFYFLFFKILLFLFYFIFFYKLGVLHTLIFTEYKWLLYITQLLYIIAHSSGIMTIHRVGKSGVLVDLLWEE